MSDTKFVKKMNVKVQKTKYGEILKLGIHKDLFNENGITSDWLNVDILRAKDTNKPYLVINDFKKSDSKQEEEPAETIIDDEEIPF